MLFHFYTLFGLLIHLENINVEWISSSKSIGTLGGKIYWIYIIKRVIYRIYLIAIMKKATYIAIWILFYESKKSEGRNERVGRAMVTFHSWHIRYAIIPVKIDFPFFSSLTNISFLLELPKTAGTILIIMEATIIPNFKRMTLLWVNGWNNVDFYHDVVSDKEVSSNSYFIKSCFIFLKNQNWWLILPNSFSASGKMIIFLFCIF